MSGCSSRHIWTISMLTVVLQQTDFGNMPRWWGPRQTDQLLLGTSIQGPAVCSHILGTWVLKYLSCFKWQYCPVLLWKWLYCFNALCVLLIIYCWAVWWFFSFVSASVKVILLDDLASAITSIYLYVCILLKWEVSKILFDVFVHSNCAVNWIVC